MERVSSMKILGVLVSNDLHATNHIEGLISSCSRSLDALRVLRYHGQRAEALHVITGATTIARLFYASPAWCGLTSAKDRSRLGQFLRRIQRMGFHHAETPTIAEMVGTAEDRLLRSIITNPHHVLRALMPPTVIRKFDLRPIDHTTLYCRTRMIATSSLEYITKARPLTNE